MFKKKFQLKGVAETFTAGDCLRRRREEAGLSLKEISVRLGIRCDYLEKLEAGDYRNLPPQVYVRGFIKSYAGFLGIDGTQLIKIYNREISFSENAGNGPKPEKKKLRKLDLRKYLVVTPRILTILASAAVISILGYYFMHQINSFNSRPYLFIENPSGDSLVTSEKVIWLSGKTERDAELRVNGQDISVSGDGSFSQKITLGEGRNSLIVEAVSRFNRSERREINVVYERPKGDAVTVEEVKEEGVVKSNNIEIEEIVEDKKIQEPIRPEKQDGKKASDREENSVVSAEGTEAVADNDKIN